MRFKSHIRSGIKPEHMQEYTLLANLSLQAFLQMIAGHTLDTLPQAFPFIAQLSEQYPADFVETTQQYTEYFLKLAVL